MRRLIICVAIVCTGVLAGVPAMAGAQTVGASISGVVEDATGALLPGVTVEAASPALIEQQRTVVTDGAGRYSIVNLRPGTYSVTFSLAGFSTVRREGIVLEGTFTAQVDAQLRVGAIEETVTVTGASPVVDVQSVSREFVVRREMLDELPGARTLQARSNLIPGVMPAATASGPYPTIHGSPATESYMFNDGMRVGQNLSGEGTLGGGWSMNEAASAELTYMIGGQSAEIQVSGVAMNAIPREGGNVFSGTIAAYGAGGGLQNDNRTEELKAVIRDADRLTSMEFNPAFGGPIHKNRLWFFAAAHVNSSKLYRADVYFPDGRQAFRHTYPNHGLLLRLTSQLTNRNRVRVSFDRSVLGIRYASVGPGPPGTGSAGGIQPEATHNTHVPLSYTPQVKWTSPVTNRLLLEAGLSTYYQRFSFRYQPEVGPFDVTHFEQTTGRTTVAASNRSENASNHVNLVASATYVTGSHNIKTGISHRWGSLEVSRPYHGDVQQLNFVSGTPTSVIVVNTPVLERDKLNADLGVYVQDTWTVKRFTFNLGARYDHFNVSIAEQTAPAGNFVPARRFAEVENHPNFNDGVVRLGVAYDLFGTGKTALKANASKFVGGASLEFTSPYNPMGLQTEQRAWRDLDGNRSVFDANGNVQDTEIGPTRNANFGLVAGTTRLDPRLPRDYNWEESVGVQHELRAGFAVTAGYYRRQSYNLVWADNLLVDPDRDYTPFTIVAPPDPRLPNGGGEVITMYNLNLEKLGAVDNLVTVSTTNRRVYDGVEVTLNARLRTGAFLFGGVTTQRTATNTCQVDNPNARRFCDNTPPFRTLFRLSGSYALPYAVQVSGNLAVVPGASVGASYAVNSAIAGVPLTGGGTLNVQLVEPNTMFLDSLTQLDVRLMRAFRIGQVRARALVEVYNVFNAGTVTQLNQTFGPSWLRPQAITQGRYLRFGTQIDF